MRIMVRALALGAIALPSTAVAQTDVPPSSLGPGCSTQFTRQDFKQEARAAYKHRHIPQATRERLDYIYTCLGTPEARSWARRYQSKVATQRRFRLALTGYVVSGGTSAFGAGSGDGDGQTADGGNTRRPCIAIRDTSTLGKWFWVSVHGHQAILLHCDSGPYVAGRSIDITGAGVLALGMSPTGYNNYYGQARMLRRHPCPGKFVC